MSEILKKYLLGTMVRAITYRTVSIDKEIKEYNRLCKYKCYENEAAIKLRELELMINNLKGD